MVEHRLRELFRLANRVHGHELRGQDRRWRPRTRWWSNKAVKEAYFGSEEVYELCLTPWELMVFYENMLALNNVSLSCADNQIIGVFGANSAGKSTLMYTLSGIMDDIAKKEQHGRRRAHNHSRARWTYQGNAASCQDKPSRPGQGRASSSARKGGRIFPESSACWKTCASRGYLAKPAQARGNPGLRLFQTFPPLDQDQDPPFGRLPLSGGEQQMLAIGRALMAQPKLLLLGRAPLMGLSARPSSTGWPSPSRKSRDHRGTAIIVSRAVCTPHHAHHRLRLHPGKRGSPVVEGTRDDLMGNPDVKAAYFGS